MHYGIILGNEDLPGLHEVTVVSSHQLVLAKLKMVIISGQKLEVSALRG